MINLILADEKKSESIKTTRRIPLVQREVQSTIYTTTNNLNFFYLQLETICARVHMCELYFTFRYSESCVPLFSNLKYIF